MHRHFIRVTRTSVAALLASLPLIFILPSAKAQDQDSNKQLGDLVAETSLLSKRICGVTAPTDAAAKKLYDERKQTLIDDATEVIKLLDQQRPKGSGYLDKALNDQITGWEKSIRSRKIMPHSSR